jgi:peroxiredoxin
VSERNLANREGQRVPEVSFRIRRQGEWATVTSDELFAHRSVVVFSLPGAFTPTCSSTHLPRFNELAPAFKAQGIDAIVCVSVNDPFVMEEWGRDQEAQNVFLLPDGNGQFTEQMGLAGRQIRFELRQAPLALLDARSRQGDRKCSSSRMSRATHSRYPTPTPCSRI